MPVPVPVSAPSVAAQLPAALLDGRRLAESRMTSRVTVRRKSGTTTVAGLKVPSWTSVATGLPFRLAGVGADGGVRGVTIGGVTYESATAEGDLPALFHDLADDDLLEVTVGEWSGTVWRVVKSVKKDQATARRVPVAEAQRPKEWT